MGRVEIFYDRHCRSLQRLGKNYAIAACESL
jgi:hypothetical protein